MRVQLKPGETNSELIRNLQQRNIAMLPYQPSSLRRIQRQNAPNGGALFDALLLLQQEDLQLDRQIWSLVEESGDMSFPFILEIVMHADTDAIWLKLHSEIAGEHFLRQVLASFDALLSHTANYPQSRALDFSAAMKELPETNPVDNTIYEATASATTQVNGYHDIDEQLSNVESLIADIMMQLRPEASIRIYRDTTIFQLGLDSINAVQIAARLRKKGYNISSADILEAASIDQIAAVCESNSQKPEPTVAFDLEAFDHRYRTSLCSANAIDEATIEAVRPCTPTQSGILSQFLRSDRRMYFNSMQFAIENGVDIAKLKEAWATVQKMHEMLRTGFVETDDPQIPFVMVTYRPDAVWLPWNSVHLPARSPTPGASQDKLDLSKPPWGVAVSSAKNTTTLELSMLHALYDAHSLETMMQDVHTLLRDEEPSPTIAPSQAISKILAMSRNEESRRFWNELASDLCPTRFPDMRVHFNDSE
jgi:aryl carrier-like protein